MWGFLAGTLEPQGLGDLGPTFHILTPSYNCRTLNL